MITTSFGYYLQKYLCLFKASGFYFFAFRGPSDGSGVSLPTDTQNVAVGFQVHYTFLVVAIVFSLLYLWMVFKFFSVRVDENGIELLKIQKNTTYRWDQIICISNTIIWSGTLYKVETTTGSFFIHADASSAKLEDVISTEPNNKMGRLFKEKKLLL